MWYLAQEIEVLQREGDPDGVVWLNYRLVQAATPSEAYARFLAHAVGEQYSYPNTDGDTIHSRFGGLRDLSLIGEHLHHGALILREYRSQTGEIPPHFPPPENKGYIPDDVTHWLAELVYQESARHRFDLRLIQAASFEEACTRAAGWAVEGKALADVAFSGIRAMFPIHEPLEAFSEVLFEDLGVLSWEDIRGLARPQPALSAFDAARNPARLSGV